MSGQKQFDVTVALDQATRLFWAKGYSNTSLRDLLRVMKIGEGSFYNSFKSKQRLYLLCLKHYDEVVTRRRWEALMAEPLIRKGVRRFFVVVLDDLDDPKLPNVCLMAASLSNDVLSSKELRKYVIDQMQAVAHALTQRFREAKAVKELPPEFNPELATQTIITFLQGLFRVVRTLHTRRQVEKQIEVLLLGLRL